MKHQCFSVNTHSQLHWYISFPFPSKSTTIYTWDIFTAYIDQQHKLPIPLCLFLPEQKENNTTTADLWITKMDFFFFFLTLPAINLFQDLSKSDLSQGKCLSLPWFPYLRLNTCRNTCPVNAGINPREGKQFVYVVLLYVFRCLKTFMLWGMFWGTNLWI